MSLTAAFLLAAAAVTDTPLSFDLAAAPVAPAVDDGPAVRLTEDRYHPRRSRYLMPRTRAPGLDADPARLRFTGRKVKLRVPLGR